MDTSQLRLCFFDVLRGMPQNGVNQYVSLVNAISQHAARRGFIAQSHTGQGLFAQNTLSSADTNKVLELFWSLVIQGVIMPGLNNNNSTWPFFSLTEYGRQVIATEDPVPHDPDHYLEHLKRVAPALDLIATAYVIEGLDCFQRGTYTAAVVMLGVAVEKLTLDLANVVQQALKGTEATRLQAHIAKDKIAKIYDEMRKRLDLRIPSFPDDLKDGLQGHLDGMFEVIRTHRNDSGHPTGRMVDRLTAFGLFSLFPFYAKRVSDLIAYIRENGLA